VKPNESVRDNLGQQGDPSFVGGAATVGTSGFHTAAPRQIVPYQDTYEDIPPHIRPQSPSSPEDPAIRRLHYIPVCSDGSKYLTHSKVIIMSNQCEDDRKTFERLQAAYKGCHGRFFDCFYKINGIYRATVLSVDRH